MELTFPKELMLIKQGNRKRTIFVILVFLNKGFKFKPNVCSRCHDVLMMSMNLSDIEILNIKDSIIGVLLAELEKMRP